MHVVGAECSDTAAAHEELRVGARMEGARLVGEKLVTLFSKRADLMIGISLQGFLFWVFYMGALLSEAWTRDIDTAIRIRSALTFTLTSILSKVQTKTVSCPSVFVVSTRRQLRLFLRRIVTMEEGNCTIASHQQLQNVFPM